MIYELFTQAMALPSAQRKDFVNSQCLDDSILAQVLALIAADNEEFTLLTDVAKESQLFQQQSTLAVGDIVSVYQLESLLGEGGMGTVYKAHRIDGNFEQTVAIKVISPHLFKLLDSHRLSSEANFMAKLNHNNLCRVYDAGVTSNGVYYIVMEYIEGREISQFFNNNKATLNQKLAVFCALCDAINYAHKQQVVHGDLKPSNILFTTNGQVKVLDFGISQIINEQNAGLTNEQSIPLHAMTTDYASPELIEGNKPSVYSDVFALGKILSSLLSQSNDDKFKPDHELLAIASKACANLAIDRYASVSELKHDIELYLSGYVVTAYQAHNLYRVQKFIFKRHPISVAAFALVLTVVSTLVINLIFKHQSLQQEKYQTDLMLEKFSLVLDLDYDAKSRIEMTLANNYQSRGENTNAEQLYRKIITRFERLHNTDLAFEAGSQLIKLLIKTKEFKKIAPAVADLKAKLTYYPNSHLPITAAQALFYHYTIDTSYIRGDGSEPETFNFHSQLLQAIKARYWHEYSNRERKELAFSMRIANHSYQEPNTRALLYHELDVSTHKQNLADSPIEKAKYLAQQFIKAQTSPNIKAAELPQSQQVLSFLESSPVYFTSTSEAHLQHEENNRAVYQAGTFKMKELNGVYKVKGNTLHIDLGEGMSSDSILYISAQLGLSVPLSSHDLTILSHQNLASPQSNQLWTRDELIKDDWYHIYGNAIKSSNAIEPTMVKINFTESSAELSASGNLLQARWKVSGSLLVLESLESSQTLAKLIKVADDNKVVIVMHKEAKVPSILVKDKELAHLIFSAWRKLLN